MAQLIPLLKALLIAVPAGALFAAAGSPLPWMIGPLVCCAAASMAGLGLDVPPAARSAGQWVIGTALGLYFTPAAVARIVDYAPWIVLGIGYALALGLSFAWALRRFAGVTRETAFFAGAIGGASEMAVQGERAGGRIDQIAAAHSIRIMIVVITLPFVYKFLDLHGSDPYETGARVVDYAGLAALAAVTCAAALAIRALDWPNAWVIGPLVVGAALTAAGQNWTMLPPVLVNAGQVLIGLSLGTRFTPDFLRQAPRFIGVVAASTVLGIVVSALFGSAIGALAGIPASTMVLATSPGGIAEMTLTAKTLRLGVPVVTVFHVTRMVAMVLVTGLVYRAVGRWRGWAR